MMRSISFAVAAALFASPAAADPKNFTRGPIITQGGGVAKIAQDLPADGGVRIEQPVQFVHSYRE